MFIKFKSGDKEIIMIELNYGNYKEEIKNRIKEIDEEINLYRLRYRQTGDYLYKQMIIALRQDKDDLILKMYEFDLLNEIKNKLK